MEKALRAAGYRLTRQRKAILNYLAAAEAHPSAQQVFQEAKKDHPGLSLATVYNTLETLARMRLIKILDFQALDNRHETNLVPHINLICTSCGKIQDFEEGSTIHAGEVKQKYGFQVENFRLEYYGLCSACRARGSNRGEV
ncbi:MAG: Fur family transcriptional regulator [Desulfobacteraceae bacterium]|jgi:Fe2+ or Zn2+ uptake regulation protein